MIKLIRSNNNRIFIGGQAPAMPSGYRLEVEGLAAASFSGRKAELRQMAEFALSADQSGYWHWSAPPWAGKTALMAQFVLRPPEGVDVLAFFISARRAGQSDRTAFLVRMRDQLREYLDEGNLECDWPGQFLEAVARAAVAAQRRGRRLVLVVDGLDEDSGVTAGGMGHSVAAVLPLSAQQAAGLRVIVASRASPQLPSDVPLNHPLRDPAVCHPLAPSKEAEAVRKDAEFDLGQMLAGSAIQQELLGLITASGGGLSARDLATIVGQAGREVLLQLQGRVGRSFEAVRPRWWQEVSATAPEDEDALFSFAHKELRAEADARIAPGVLAAKRAAVHDFVDQWRAAGWPPQTPEYALDGYPRLLKAVGDVERLTTLALDERRQERLWTVFGSDVQARSEIEGALDLHVTRMDDGADLGACTRLAFERERIDCHPSRLPASVIATWARLGHGRRALRLAGSQPEVRLPAQLVVADSAPEMIAGALKLARRFPTADECASALAGIAEALAGARPDQAAAIARESAGLASDVGVARALAGTGQLRAASDVVAAANGTDHAFLEVLKVAAGAGFDASTASVAREIAAGLTLPEVRVRGFAAIIPALFAFDIQVARAAVEQARAEALSVRSQIQRVTLQLEIAAAVGGLDPDLAQELTAPGAAVAARGEQNWAGIAQIVCPLAVALAASGRLSEAAQAAGQATVLLPESTFRETVIRVASALAGAGRPDDATDVASLVTVEPFRSLAFTVAGRAMAHAGQIREATELSRRIAEAAHFERFQLLLACISASPDGTQPATRSLLRQALAAARRQDWDQRVPALTQLAWALTRLNPAAAEAALEEAQAEVRRGGLSGLQRTNGLVWIAEALATNKHADALEFARAALMATQAMERSEGPHHQLPKIVGALAQAGDVTAAENLARSIDNTPARVAALARLAFALVVTGRHDQAAKFAAEAQQLATTGQVGYGAHTDDISLALLATAPREYVRSVADQRRRYSRSAEIDVAAAEALLAAGYEDDARDALNNVQNDRERAWAWARVAVACAGLDNDAGITFALQAYRWARLADEGSLARVFALSCASRALAANGVPSARGVALEALEAADMLDDTRNRPLACLDAARALIATGDAATRTTATGWEEIGPAPGTQAARLMCEALASEQWRTCLVEVANVAPDAVRSVGHLLDGRLEQFPRPDIP